MKTNDKRQKKTWKEIINEEKWYENTLSYEDMLDILINEYWKDEETRESEHGKFYALVEKVQAWNECKIPGWSNNWKKRDEQALRLLSLQQITEQARQG